MLRSPPRSEKVQFDADSSDRQSHELDLPQGRVRLRGRSAPAGILQPAAGALRRARRTTSTPGRRRGRGRGRKLKVIDVGCTIGHSVPSSRTAAALRGDRNLRRPTSGSSRSIVRSATRRSSVDDLTARQSQDAVRMRSTSSSASRCWSICRASIWRSPRLERMAKPGGKVCIGVPIFLPPLAGVARRLGAELRSSGGRRKNGATSRPSRSARSCARSAAIRASSSIEARGFRVISGGPCGRSSITAGGGVSIAASARWRPGRASRSRRS